MLRLMTELEKNTSWIPFEKLFMTEDEARKIIENTKSADTPVSFSRETLPDTYFESNTPPTAPTSVKEDGIEITEVKSDAL